MAHNTFSDPDQAVPAPVKGAGRPAFSGAFDTQHALAVLVGGSLLVLVALRRSFRRYMP